jgi:hypothetical protein
MTTWRLECALLGKQNQSYCFLSIIHELILACHGQRKAADDGAPYANTISNSYRKLRTSGQDGERQMNEGYVPGKSQEIGRSWKDGRPR